MAQTTFVVIVCTIAIILPTSATSRSPNQHAVLSRLAQEPEFQSIGQIGRKIFIKHTDQVNWMAGRAICQEAGLEYATVQSDSEFNFVYANGNITTGLWTSGILRDAMEFNVPSAFHWDATRDDVPMGINYYISSPQWLCLYISPGHLTQPGFCVIDARETLCQLRL